MLVLPSRTTVSSLAYDQKVRLWWSHQPPLALCLLLQSEPLTHFKHQPISLPSFSSIRHWCSLCRGPDGPQRHIQGRCILGQSCSKSAASEGGCCSAKAKIIYCSCNKIGIIDNKEGYLKGCQVDVLYQYSSVVDQTEWEALAACSTGQGEPSPAAGVGGGGRWWRRFGDMARGVDQIVVWYWRCKRVHNCRKWHRDIETRNII